MFAMVCVYVVAACRIRCTYIVFVPIGLVLYTYTCNLCAVKGGSTEKPVTWELHMHEENTVYTTPCETMLSQFFKNLANVFFVLSASCSTCSEFHLLFLTTRCRCSVTVLSTKLLCCNYSLSTLIYHSEQVERGTVFLSWIMNIVTNFLLSVLCKRTKALTYHNLY